MSDDESAPCAVRVRDLETGETTECDGRVFITEPLRPLDDGTGRWYGAQVCDTCQALYETWCDEDGGNCAMNVTTGRARGRPDSETHTQVWEMEVEEPDEGELP